MDGRVVGIGDDLRADRELDATGCVVAPGLVDLHTHLREPGREEAETIETGSRAAALGGFTAVVAMPNTDPPIDDASVVREVLELGRESVCDVRVAGAITRGRLGEQLAPMAEMAGLGVRLFTDDGDGVQDDRLMRRALEYASGLGVTLAQHCEVDALADGGHMHEGEVSSRLGIPAVPPEAEELMVARDLALARLTGATVHFQHLSTRRSVALVADAKRVGLPVTAEATTHHFTLTDADVAGYDPLFKVNPPLRSADDVAAVRAGLADGTLDAVATDHAPHTQETKELPFDEAPPGMLGLETALALALTEPRPRCVRGARAPLVATGGVSPGSTPPTAVRSARGRRQPLCPGPRRDLDRRSRRAGQSQPEHALHRADPDRTGPPHPPVGGAGRRRRGGAAMSIRAAALVLADGTVFEGEAIGADPPGGVATGEVVFNTVLTGYQEVITDPSYAGQIIAFTYPHIGNYGVTPDDDESRRPFCRGVVVRDARPAAEQLAVRGTTSTAS
ncbi:MAG: dihydroorotase [Acidimicrobiia bacterium]|nr:dihydroorotase [Acidimicrobiia bacterium]